MNGSSASGAFRWVRLPDEPLTFQLRDNGGVRITVRAQEGSGRSLIVQAPSGNWAIRREGFWTPRIRLQEETTAAEIAELATTWRRGRALVFGDGTAYTWRRLRRLRRQAAEWWFADQVERKVLRFWDASLVRKEFSAAAEVLEPGLPQIRVDALLVAGLYWLLLDLVLEGHVRTARRSLGAIGGAAR